MSNNSFHRATLASAGTGKTYSLVENYLYALFGLDDSGQKKRPSQILALTFTEKAAQEMRIRIARRLQAFLKEPARDDPLFKMAELKGVSLPSSHEIGLLLRALPNAVISTFHAFASSMLKQEAALLGLSPQFSIMQPSEERTLAQNILRPMLIEHIKQGDGRFRSVIARFRLGGGSYEQGLIDGIINFYFKLFEKGVTPSDEFFTASEKPAWQAIEQQTGRIISSFDVFCGAAKTPSAQTRVHEIRQALNEFTEAFPAQEEKIIADKFLALRTSVKGNFGDRVLRAELVSEIVSLGALLCDYFVADDEALLCTLIKAFHQEITSVKAATLQRSFSDLLLTVRDNLRDNLAFRELIKARFLHVMVDEYQDTSPLQEEIIALIAESKNNTHVFKSGDDVLELIDFRHGASLFVVGDKKQSIYGFRGADSSLFDRMLKKMVATHQHSGAFTKSVLQTNYRSHAHVIELINHVSRTSLSSQGYSDEDDLSPHHQGFTGESALWVSHDDGQKSPHFANLLCAAHGIAQLLSERSSVKARDITVLVRRIKSARVIKDELFSLGIAARIVGGEGFFQQQEVIDILSFFKLLVDPGSTHALLTLARSPLLLLSDQEIVELVARDKFSLMQLADEEATRQLSPASKKRLERFLHALQVVESSIAEQGLALALDLAMNLLDMSFSIGMMHQPEQKFANIKKLRTLMMGTKENYIRQINTLYQKIADDVSEPLAPDTASDEAVTIMTIHQSKGLEFDIVVVADTESVMPHLGPDFVFDKKTGFSIKPKHRPIAVCMPDSTERDMASTRMQKIQDNNRALEKAEMARLLYVALTRAKKEIYFSASNAAVTKPKADTLLGMLLRAQTMPLKRRIISFHQTLSPSLSESEEYPIGHLFKPEIEARRLFSSALIPLTEENYSRLITTTIKTDFRAIDGNLAHDLMAQVGAQIAKMDELDDGTLWHVLESAGRGRGMYHDQKKYERSLQACFVSLKQLHEHFKHAKKVIFEAPLFSKPRERVMIEGFSDAVLVFDDWLGVIEFKSSYRLATAAQTYLQVFAYAYALKQFALPIKYAVSLIGAHSPIQWQDFDEYCEQLLMEALQ